MKTTIQQENQVEKLLYKKKSYWFKIYNKSEKNHSVTSIYKYTSLSLSLKKNQNKEEKRTQTSFSQENFRIPARYLFHVQAFIPVKKIRKWQL